MRFWLCTSHCFAAGSIKSKINASTYKCSGNVEVYYEGQWLAVCMDALASIETQNTICGELKCGQAVKTVDYFGPKLAGARVISQIQCSANGNKTLKECSITADKRTCTLGGLRCSSMCNDFVSNLMFVFFHYHFTLSEEVACWKICKLILTGLWPMCNLHLKVPANYLMSFWILLFPESYITCPCYLQQAGKRWSSNSTNPAVELCLFTQRDKEALSPWTAGQKQRAGRYAKIWNVATSSQTQQLNQAILSGTIASAVKV